MYEKTKILWIDSHEFKGGFDPKENLVIISAHMPPELTKFVLKHELEHARLWNTRGFKSLPRQIWLDYTNSFSVFANDVLRTQNFKHHAKLSVKKRLGISAFHILYYLAMTFNMLCMYAGWIYAKIKSKI